MSVAGVEIRDAGPGDARTVAALWRESAQAHVSMSDRFYVVPTFDEVLARAERQLADPARVVLVAIADARIVGAVEMSPLPPPTPGSMIRSIRAVDIGVVVGADHRGRGIGRALMEAAERRAASDGIELLTLNARVENEAAIGLYRAIGYEASGVLMHKWLG